MTATAPTLWLDSTPWWPAEPALVLDTYGTLTDQELPTGWSWRWQLGDAGVPPPGTMQRDTRVTSSPSVRSPTLRMPLRPGWLLRDRALDELVEAHLRHPDAARIDSLHGSIVGRRVRVLRPTLTVPGARGAPRVVNVETVLIPELSQACCCT